MNEKRLSYGVIGAGFIANNVHLPILCNKKEVQVIALCDENENKARSTAKFFGIPRVYPSFSEMLMKENLDVVDILTPPRSHFNLAISSLKAGCHCMVEKPLTTTMADADVVIRVAKEENRALHVIHNFSFMPCMRKAKQIESASKLGDLVCVDVRYLSSLKIEMQRYAEASHWCHDLPGDVFYDLAPHLIMLILDYLHEVKRIKKVVMNLFNDPTVQANELRVTFEAENGLGSLAISFNSLARCFSIDVIKTNGRLFINADNQIVIKYKAMRPTDPTSLVSKGARTLGEVYQQLAGLSSNAFCSITGRYRSLHTESHGYLISKSVNSLQGRGTYPVDLWKAREVVRLLEEILGSGSAAKQ